MFYCSILAAAVAFVQYAPALMAAPGHCPTAIAYSSDGFKRPDAAAESLLSSSLPSCLAASRFHSHSRSQPTLLSSLVSLYSVCNLNQEACFQMEPSWHRSWL